MKGVSDFLSWVLPQSMPWQDDPHGVLHRLFWHQIPPDTPEVWFRIVGVVHLFASSGIHVYAFLETLDRWCRPWVLNSNRSIRFWKTLIWWLGLALILWAWALQGFRLGFARPLLTFGIRRWGRHRGARFRILAPVLITGFLDFAFDFGRGASHYYLAVAGGLLALEWARSSQNQNTSKWVQEFRFHSAMAVGSWVTTFPLDLIEHHRVAWATPIFSLLTLPLLTLGLYPITLIQLFVNHEVSPCSSTFGRRPSRPWSRSLNKCRGPLR